MCDECVASRWCFDKLYERSSNPSIKHDEASNSAKATAESYKREFSEFMKAEGTQQVFNCG